MNATVPVESGQNKNHRLRLVVGCVVCLLVGLVIGHMITYHWAMEQVTLPPSPLPIRQCC